MQHSPLAPCLVMAFPAVTIPFTTRQRVFGGELMPSFAVGFAYILVASSVTPFGYFVVYVILICSGKKMRGVDASGVVA